MVELLTAVNAFSPGGLVFPYALYLNDKLKEAPSSNLHKASGTFCYSNIIAAKLGNFSLDF